jgi:hypothetical protein
MLKCVCLRILASSRIPRYDLGRQTPHFWGSSVTAALSSFPCQRTEFPISYLGVPLSMFKLPRSSLQPIVDKMAGTLPTWKGKLLHHSGRLTVIKTTLAAIPVYTAISIELPPGFTSRWRTSWKVFCGLAQNGSRRQMPCRLGQGPVTLALGRPRSGRPYSSWPCTSCSLAMDAENRPIMIMGRVALPSDPCYRGFLHGIDHMCGWQWWEHLLLVRSMVGWPVPGKPSDATGRGCVNPVEMSAHGSSGFGKLGLDSGYPRSANHPGVNQYLHLRQQLQCLVLSLKRTWLFVVGHCRVSTWWAPQIRRC